MALLIDTIEFTPRILESSENGTMKIEGVFQRCDTKNANNRVYPRKIWERLLSNKSSLIERMQSRAVIGHLEHPSDGVTDLRKGAILITGLKLDEKGQVIGTAEVLDTPDGKIIQEYVRKKVRIGISSRGSGTVGSDGKVSDDYNAESFDIVYNPSTPGAFPEAVGESVAVKNNASESANSNKENLMEGLEKFQLIESQVKPILEGSTDGLTPLQVTELSGKLLEHSVKLGALVSDNPALNGVIGKLQESIGEKRNALNKPATKTESGTTLDEAAVKAVEALIDEATTKFDESAATVEELTGKVTEAEERAKSMESLLSEAEEDSDEENKAAAALYEAQAKKLAEAQERVTELEEKLAAAVSLISRMLAERADSEGGDDELAESISDAIAEVIEAEPRLKEAVDILADCTSVDEVYKTAKGLVAELKESQSRKGSAKPAILEQLERDHGTKPSRAPRRNIFEEAELSDLSSDEDTRDGEYQSETDASRLNEHKGRRLVASALKAING